MSDTESARTPFEPGAPAAAGAIPLAVPHLVGNEWAYVKEALDTNWVSSAGPFVDRFERMVAGVVDTPHAVAVASGTAALHVALLAAGVEPGDEVLVSTLSFIAPANAIRYAGAHPVFVDAEPEYWQIDADKVETFLARECTVEGGRLVNRSTGRRVRALLPVHALGHPARIEQLAELAERFELALVEDAAESLGARAGGRHVGTFGIAGCLSFNGNKLATSGGGGMVVTADEAFAGRVRYLTTQAKDDPVEYVHGEVGFNYRLGNVQAALGCAQLEQLDALVAAKRRIADRYREAFAGLDGVTTMSEAPGAFAVHWLSTILLDSAVTGIDRRGLHEALAERRIQTRPLWQPLHVSPAHAGAQVCGGEVAERIAAEALSLPSSTGLAVEEQERVIAAVVEACRG